MKKKTDTEINEKHIHEANEWKAKYLRALADYQNLEKWTVEQSHETRKYAIERFVKTLLPVVDNLERANKHVSDDGLSLVVKQFEKTLNDAGVTRIEVIGKPFNPGEMECVSLVPGENGKIIEEIVPGYTMFGKIIRVAQVNVGAGDQGKSVSDQKV